MNALTALLAGLLAGLGIAVPLGAIAVLLVSEGVNRGFRRGAPGAIAVGVVDTLYCTAAVTVGALAAPVVTSWGRWPALVGGCALLTLAVVGLWRSLSQPPAGDATGTPTGTGWHRFALFLGLTAINPATLIYFGAITVGMADLLRSPLAAGLFVAGVGTASITWQLVVVAAGSLLRGRLTPGARRVTALIGNVIVAGLGVAMILGALLS
ncbi:MAG TPA: LysE family transporter [Propionicimonas sp.]|jgi:threonine/homoserine/homoserine lactone efflux protein|uniref:LysE family transporter n=1 Tax=Propionicimonas sp. TaxID=1955623 RepID=UPI002F3F186E